MSRAKLSDEEFAKLQRKTGLLIGTIQVDIPDDLYAQYPEISDLK